MHLKSLAHLGRKYPCIVVREPMQSCSSCNGSVGHDQFFEDTRLEDKKLVHFSSYFFFWRCFNIPFPLISFPSSSTPCYYFPVVQFPRLARDQRVTVTLCASTAEPRKDEINEIGKSRGVEVQEGKWKCRREVLQVPEGEGGGGAGGGAGRSNEVSPDTKSNTKAQIMKRFERIQT